LRKEIVNRKKTLYNNNEMHDETTIGGFEFSRRNDIIIRDDSDRWFASKLFLQVCISCIPNYTCKRNPSHRCNWHAPSETKIKIYKWYFVFNYTQLIISLFLIVLIIYINSQSIFLSIYLNISKKKTIKKIIRFFSDISFNIH